MLAGVGVQRFSAEANASNNARHWARGTCSSSHWTRNCTGTVIRAAVLASAVDPSRSRTAARTRCSAAMNGDTEPAAHRHTPIAHRTGADMVELLDRGQDGLPFRDGLLGQVPAWRRPVRTDPRRQPYRPASGPRSGRSLARRPLAVVRHVDRGDRKPALDDEAARAGPVSAPPVRHESTSCQKKWINLFIAPRRNRFCGQASGGSRAGRPRGSICCGGTTASTQPADPPPTRRHFSRVVDSRRCARRRAGCRRVCHRHPANPSGL